MPVSHSARAPFALLFLLAACNDRRVVIRGSVATASVASAPLGAMATMVNAVTGPVVCSSKGDDITCSPPAGAPAKTTPTPPTAPPVGSTPGNVCAEVAHPPQGPVPDAIGDITMLPDGTIVENLVARGAGAIGHAQHRYKKGDPQYAEHLTHVGGLNPCESKLIPPWN